MFWGMWSSTYAYDGRTANQADGFTNENMPIAYTNYGHNYYAFASSGGSYLVKTSSGCLTILGNSTEDQAWYYTKQSSAYGDILREYKCEHHIDISLWIYQYSVRFMRLVPVIILLVDKRILMRIQQ